MQRPRTVDVVVAVGFVLAVCSAGAIQAVVELYRGQRLQALDIFRQRLLAANVRAYEKNLEDFSWVLQKLRPQMQYLQYVLLNDAGEKALPGLDGWMFYRPGVEYLIAGDRTLVKAQGGRDPVPAIVAFRDELALRGIRLLVVPAPNKESVYPEKLTSRAAGLGGIRSGQTSDLLNRLAMAKVETVDLFEVFVQAKKRKTIPTDSSLYLVQDSHWSPVGVTVAARAIAGRLLDRGWIGLGPVSYETKLVPVQRVGDVLRMLQVPQIEKTATPESVSCSQVIHPDSGRPYQNDPDSDVLVIGDSFLRIYETDEPGSAGLIAHLAKDLKRPLTSLVNDGGASTLVRQELYRRPALLKSKKVVIWEFVERDIAFGAEGWQVIPLPPVPSGTAEKSPETKGL
jgi:hypothetical protein